MSVLCVFSIFLAKALTKRKKRAYFVADLINPQYFESFP